MSSFQQVTILGNLGDDPKLTMFDGGGCVVNISVATTEKWTDKNSNEKKEATEWHRCVAFNKSAELIDKYLSKGDTIMLTGKIKTRKYQGNDGTDRYTTEIWMDTFKFVKTKGKEDQNNQGSAVEQYQQKAAGSNSAPAPDDDLPF